MDLALAWLLLTVEPERCLRAILKTDPRFWFGKAKKKNPRRLTPRECARLMGFPDDFPIPVSDTQGYKQFGNSVIPPLIRVLAKAMHPHIVALRAEAENELQTRMAV